MPYNPVLLKKKKLFPTSRIAGGQPLLRYYRQGMSQGEMRVLRAAYYGLLFIDSKKLTSSQLPQHLLKDYHNRRDPQGLKVLFKSIAANFIYSIDKSVSSRAYVELSAMRGYTSSKPMGSAGCTHLPANGPHRIDAKPVSSQPLWRVVQVNEVTVQKSLHQPADGRVHFLGL
ncbi:hypothetical protein TcWFU_007460 [Taenia crassiceps]|uniref:Uncharacterized protein n=1 Tax=Taenia crassiceps TaxID=6207 RepID=A0ABR4QNL1_9CEST